MSQFSNSPETAKHLTKFKRKIKKQRPFAFAVAVLICAVAWLVGAYLVNGSAQPGDATMPVPSGLSADSDNQHYPTPHHQATFMTLTFSQLAEKSNDHLLLVNMDYAVPGYIAGSKDRIAGYVTALSPDMLLNEDALVMLRAMFDSAAGVGFNQFRVTQGYRTHEYQQDLYDRMAGTGLAARPGHSEHQVGLAVDISYHGVNIGNSRQGQWLMNYSYRYGFILRYPEHKTDITGVPFEPWHYRYVGQPHAYFMTQGDIVLEEYIALLRKNREIAVTFEGVEFSIHYLAHEYESVDIPEGNLFWASRDNTGGVIVTVWN